MTNIENFIKIYDNVVHPKFVSYMVRYFNTLEDFKDAAIVGKNGENQIDKKVRDVQSYGLNRVRESLTSVFIHNKLTKMIFKQINEYQKIHSFAQVKYLDMSVLKYGLGGHYKWHVDAGTTLNRSLSIIITLNNDYEGGNLLISPSGDEKDKIIIKPGVGKMIIWPSNFMFPHMVEPVTKGKRYSIVGWLW